MKSILVGALFLAACGSKNTNTELQHVFGETSDKRFRPLQDCKKTIQEFRQPGSENAVAYFESLVDDIIARNNASHKNEADRVFQGNLDRSRFCIGVDLSDKVNAFAQPINGSLIFNIGVLNIADNDAMAAFIVGHELAHVTLDHIETHNMDHYLKPLNETEKLTVESLVREHNPMIAEAGMTREAMNKIVDVTQITKKDFAPAPAGWLQNVLNKKLCQNQCDTFTALFKKYFDDILPPLRTNIQAQSEIMKKYFTLEELSNKREEDADEVALEFMARADIDIELAPFVPDAVNFLYTNQPYCDDKVNRGTDSHPTACWRIDNQLSEIDMHQVDYAPFLKERRINFIGTNDGKVPTLDALKKEYKIGLHKK